MALHAVYGYGTYSVDGRIYVWLFKNEVDQFYGRPIANRLLYTDDYGRTFHRWDGKEVDGETPVWTADMAERGATVIYPPWNVNGEEWHWSALPVGEEV